MTTSLASPRPHLSPLISLAALCAAALIALAISASAAVAAGPPGPAPQPSAATNPFTVNERLARTLNLGGVHELGPTESWGPNLEDADYERIAAAGFSAVRLPVAWDLYAEANAPYTIQPEFFARIDRALANAESNGLAMVLNMHIYDGLTEENTAAHRTRFVGLWRQVAARYADRSENVVFELFNEPNTALTTESWNPLMAETIAAVRESNPFRTIMVGPGTWYSDEEFADLEIPAGETNLITTFHYYEPFEFSHQGATWLEAQGSRNWLGTRWNTGTGGPPVDAAFARAAATARGWNLPVFAGEFGVLNNANRDDRLVYTRWVREAAENNGFSWGYWEWGRSGVFGVHDNRNDLWQPELVGALMGSRCAPVTADPVGGGSGQVNLNAEQLLINQRIGQAALRRINAIQEWIDSGVEARDICGSSLSAGNFDDSVTLAPADVPPAAVADPRPLNIAPRQPSNGQVALTPEQLLINQRIYQAGIRRAAALRKRLGNLAGGDVANGAIGSGMFIGGWAVASARPGGTEQPAAPVPAEDPAPPSTSGLELSARQLLTNQRIAQKAVRDANTLRRMIESGLTGSNFRDGSLSAADLGS